MTTPAAPVPAGVEKWISRSRYLRWVDGLAGWLVLVGGAAALAGGSRSGLGALRGPAGTLLALRLARHQLGFRDGNDDVVHLAADEVDIARSALPGHVVAFVDDRRLAVLLQQHPRQRLAEA